MSNLSKEYAGRLTVLGVGLQNGMTAAVAYRLCHTWQLKEVPRVFPGKTKIVLGMGS